MDASPPKIELGLDDGARHTAASRAVPLAESAVPSLLCSSRPDALQALLAFSFFHEQVRRSRLQKQIWSGAAGRVALPLFGQHNVVGLLEAFSRDAYAFNESDVRSLSLLGELILAALRPEQEERLSEVASAAIFDTTESSALVDATESFMSAGSRPAPDPLAREIPERHVQEIEEIGRAHV